MISGTEQKRTILLIDDEKPLMESVKVNLEFAGYEVVMAQGGTEGLKIAKEQNPDLIMLDIMMAVIDGYHVCRMLKFGGAHKDTPVIVLSARSQQADKETARKVGADAYIVKPFEWDELLRTIERLLGRRDLNYIA